MCFTCVSLASPPCGCSGWHLIARSCVLHSRFCRIAICRWCHFLFEGKRVWSQFDSKCWTLNCFLCHRDNKQQGLMSLEGFDSTEHFRDRNNSGRATVCRGRKQQTWMFPWAVLSFQRLFLKIRAATFGGHGWCCCKHKADVQGCKWRILKQVQAFRDRFIVYFSVKQLKDFIGFIACLEEEK